MASVSIPETHAAWTYTRRGDPAQILNLTWNFPTPDPASLKPGEALIKVSAVALNSGTLSLMRKIPHFTNNPWVPEIDFAGTIVALAPDDGTNKGNEGEGEGEGDADFQVGDQIVGLRTIPFLLKYNGVLQEYLVSPVSVLAKKPESLSMVEASGLPAVGCTAVQAVNVAGVKKGNKVLVTAASGGLGSMLVQVAKAVVGPDGVVVGSCSGKNQELVRSLGADETIDYTLQPLHTYLASHHSASTTSTLSASSRPFDIIFDIAGTSNDLFTSSPQYLAESGCFVCLGNIHLQNPDSSFFTFLSWTLSLTSNRHRPLLLGGTPRKFQFYSASPTGEDTRKVLQMAAKGQVKPVVDSVWKMNDALKAYERATTQKARGKIVVDLE